MPAVDPEGSPPPLTFWRLFGRAALRQCPVCGGGKIFRRWTQMAERCPTCGLRFERIEGHWIGALGVNSVVSFATLLIVLVIAFIVTYDDPSVPMLLGITVGVAIIGPLFFFPYTRTFWTAFDLLVRPLTPEDEVDPRYLPPPRKPW